MITSVVERCSECDHGVVEPVGGTGRLFLYRKGCRLELPEEFPVPTCGSCGAQFIDAEVSKAASEVLRPAFMARQAAHVSFLVERIRERHGCTLGQIEAACGVTPTYLSHVVKGRKEPDELSPEAWEWHRCSDGPACEPRGLFASDHRVTCTDEPPPRLVGDIWPTLHHRDWDMDELLKLVMEDYRR